MRFKLGPLPANEAFSPLETGWRRSREPGAVWLQVIAVPAAVVLVAVFGLALGMFTWSGSIDVNMNLMRWGIVIMIPIHELVHAVTTPGWGMSDKTVVGFWARRLLPYAVYTEALTRRQIMWLILMPFVALSVVPAAVQLALGVDSEVLTHLVVINAGLCSGDIPLAFVFWFGTPRGALVRNKGYDSYWKAGEAGDEAGAECDGP
ncbi:MAG: hypothetical protein CMJ49_08905 [Planctomycetaceae bacterium]|nr:hypothetical protein [Planctomycetaceae bacterium]